MLQNVQASALRTNNFNPNFPPDGSAAQGQLISGTNNSDTLVGGFGHDTIHGNAGNDTIDGQAGSDTIYGGDGNDNLTGNFGNDRLYGDAGDDTLFDDRAPAPSMAVMATIASPLSLQGSHTLLGGSGRDTLNTTGNHPPRWWFGQRQPPGPWSDLSFLRPTSTRHISLHGGLGADSRLSTNRRTFVVVTTTSGLAIRATSSSLARRRRHAIYTSMILPVHRRR